MQHDTIPTTEQPILGTVAERALAAGTPRSVAVEALRATEARFGPRRGGRRASRARMEAYFWGVVRRRALQGAAPAVSRRLVIASLESELREAGHTPEAISRELARLYSSSDSAIPASERVA